MGENMHNTHAETQRQIKINFAPNLFTLWAILFFNWHTNDNSIQNVEPQRWRFIILSNTRSGRILGTHKSIVFET